MSCCVVLYRVVFCCVRCVALHRVVVCCIALCCAVLCCVVLCYVVMGWVFCCVAALLTYHENRGKTPVFRIRTGTEVQGGRG